VQLLDGLIGGLEAARAAGQGISEAERGDVRRCKARLQHLADIGECPRGSTIPWTRQRMDLILSDFMLR